MSRASCNCSKCRTCKRRQARQRRMQNAAYRERELAKGRARHHRRMADPEEAERSRARDRTRRAANREAERKRRRAAYWRNPERARAGVRDYYHRRRAEEKRLMATPGLAFDELAVVCPGNMTWLRFVLRDEVRRGRLHRDRDGVYRVRPAAFDPVIVEAFLALDGRITVNGNGRGAVIEHEEAQDDEREERWRLREGEGGERRGLGRRGNGRG